VTERLKGVTIEHRDALEIIKQQDHLETLFYVDPPYLQTTRPNSSKRQYRFELGPQEHRALARLLHGVKGKVLLSGYASELYDNELYNDWRREEKISWANGQSGRVERLEVLWMNF
jgi:DNA adenine methylase